MAILISLALRMLSSAFCAWAAGAIRAADRPAAANTPRVRRRVDEVTVRTVVIAGLLGRWMRRQGRLGQTLGGGGAGRGLCRPAAGGRPGPAGGSLLACRRRADCTVPMCSDISASARAM